jgi:KDO2-lipid IV(A) lauroyltransferase
LSDFLAFIFYNIIKYRKIVIVTNLKNAFPKKSEFEIKKLTKAFYCNLSDITFEIIKLESISRKELNKRVNIQGQEVLEKISARKEGVVIVMSHTGNWEWISQRLCFEGFGFDDVGVIAKEMSNPYFESYFTHIRMRLQKGIATIIPFKETARQLATKRHKASMIIAIADQSPHKDQIQFRTSFLNQDTGVFLGPERIARSLNYAIVFCHVQHKGQGIYEASFELITDTPSETSEYFITETHVKMLEADIRNEPESWLWSHRRWKY